MLYIGAIDDRRRSILNLSSLLAINHPVKIEEIMKKSLSWIGIVILAAILDIYNKFISNSPSFEQRAQSSSSPPLRKIELCACKSFIRGGEGRERGREIDGGLKRSGFFRRTRFTRSFFSLSRDVSARKLVDFGSSAGRLFYQKARGEEIYGYCWPRRGGPFPSLSLLLSIPRGGLNEYLESFASCHFFPSKRLLL